MKRAETQIDQLANQLVKDQAATYPSFATSIGYPGGEGDMDDYSPEAMAQEQKDIKSLLGNRLVSGRRFSRRLKFNGLLQRQLDGRACSLKGWQLRQRPQPHVVEKPARGAK